MKKLELAVCDDQVSILQVVSGAIISTFRQHEIDATVEVFSRAAELERRMKTKSFRLIFLDIDMPGMDGLTFARKLREKNVKTDILFISNREDKVFDALRLNPAGFIRKSRFLEDVSAVIEQWLKNCPPEEEQALVFQQRDSVCSIPLDKILYVESIGKLQYVHQTGKEEPASMRRSMHELEELLTPQGFLRIHTGYLVNYRFIRRLDDHEAVLTNGETLPLSRRRVKEVRDQYLTLMQGGGTLIL